MSLLPKLAPAPNAEAITPPRNFDSTFEKYRGDIPLEYLRALAIVSGNGDFKPNQSDNVSAGMFMISLPSLDAFGKAHGRSFKPTDLADVQLNTEVAVWLINNVRKYYSINYPKSLGENWRNTDYVAIVTLGYKIGHSENGGIGDALKVIEKLYPEKMTIDNVAAAAKEKKLATYLYSPKWIEFSKHVANLYAGSPRDTVSPVSLPVPLSEGGGSGGSGKAALILIPLAIVVAMALGKK